MGNLQAKASWWCKSGLNMTNFKVFTYMTKFIISPNRATKVFGTLIDAPSDQGFKYESYYTHWDT